MPGIVVASSATPRHGTRSVCSALEADPATMRDKLREARNAQKGRYKRWFDQHLSDKFWHLTGDDCYRLRCGAVHQGRFGRPDDKYDRIGFAVARQSESVARGCLHTFGGF